MSKSDNRCDRTNEAAYSSVDGHQVQRFIRNLSAEVQRAEDTSLASEDHNVQRIVEVLRDLSGVSNGHIDHNESDGSNA